MTQGDVLNDSQSLMKDCASSFVTVCRVSKLWGDSFSAMQQLRGFRLFVVAYSVCTFCGVEKDYDHTRQRSTYICSFGTGCTAWKQYQQCCHGIRTGYRWGVSGKFPDWWQLLPPTRTRAGWSVWSKKRPWMVSKVPPMTLPLDGETPVTSEHET